MPIGSNTERTPNNHVVLASDFNTERRIILLWLHPETLHQTSP